jgi:nucleoside-diphosphate-sugar epimerase
MELSFAGKHILVVGGAGFVGSNLVKLLLDDNPQRITIVDNFLSAEPCNVPEAEQIHLIRQSITNDEVLASLKDDIDFVFHLATYHGNQSSIHDPLADHENNTLTTLKLMNRLSQFSNIEKVVYSSAGCSVAEKTFDNAVATTEDAPISLVQNSPYSISKVIGEFYAVYFHRQHQLPTVRARFQNVYGPGEILGAGQWRGTPATVWRNVTPTFIYKSMKGIALPVEGDGDASRDFIFVDDICRGLIACALKGEPGDVYNLATQQETTILELANTINEKTANPAGIEHLPRRTWDHSGKRYGSTEKALKALGFEAQVSLSDGLERTVEWTHANLATIEACMEQHANRMQGSD